MATRSTSKKSTSKTTTTARKPAGKAIPPAPEKRAAAEAEDGARSAAPAVATADPATFGAPGSTLNPSDPAAPNYAFAPQGLTAPDVNALEGIDKGSGVQQPTPVFNVVPEGGNGPSEDDSGGTWVDEQTTLGRRIAFTVGAGEEGAPTTTFEEVVAHGAGEALVHQARERIRRKLQAA